MKPPSEVEPPYAYTDRSSTVAAKARLREWQRLIRLYPATFAPVLTGIFNDVTGGAFSSDEILKLYDPGSVLSIMERLVWSGSFLCAVSVPVTKLPEIARVEYRRRPVAEGLQHNAMSAYIRTDTPLRLLLYTDGQQITTAEAATGKWWYVVRADRFTDSQHDAILRNISKYAAVIPPTRAIRLEGGLDVMLSQYVGDGFAAETDLGTIQGMFQKRAGDLRFEKILGTGVVPDWNLDINTQNIVITPDGRPYYVDGEVIGF